MRGIQASSLEIRADSPGISRGSAFNKNGFAALFAIKAAQYRPLGSIVNYSDYDGDFEYADVAAMAQLAAF